MKILRAEKFQPKRRNTKQPKTKLRKTDWDVLMQHDRFSGKLNRRCEAALKNRGSIKRLLEAEMIDPNGYITSEGRKKCAALSQKTKKPEPAEDAASEALKTEKALGIEEKQADNMTASDWAVLMKYDRISGNLLKYNPETGELDETSRAILQDPSIIQRLIDNNMILPGGWLTPEAKLECDRIEKKLKNQAADDYTEQKVSPNPEAQSDVNPERLLKDENQSKDASEVIADPGVYPEQTSRDLTEKSTAESSSDEHSKEYAIRQHYPDLNDQSDQNIKQKTMVYPDSKSHLENMPNGERKSNPLKKDDLQAFFMNLADPSSGQEPKGYPEHLSVDRQQTGLLPAHIQRKDTEKIREPSKTAVVPIKASVSGESALPVDLRAVSKPEEEDKERPKRKKKGSGGSGGDIPEPPGFSLRDIFHIAFKRKIEIFLFFIAVFLTVAIGTFMAKPVYEATAQLLVKIGRESIFVPATGNLNPVIRYNREERINSEIQILKSRALAEKVVTALGPTEIYESLKEGDSGIFNRWFTRIFDRWFTRIFDRWFTRKDTKMSSEAISALKFENAVENLQQALRIEGIKNSDVIKIQFQHENPIMCAKVINYLAENYLEYHLAVHKTPQKSKFFKEQLDLLKNKIDQAEESLRALRKQHNITSLEEQRTLLLGQSAELSSSLNQTISLEVENEKRIRQLRKQLENVPQTIPQGEETDQNPYLINTLEARLVELQLKEKELLTKYTDQSRLVRNVKEEIRIVQRKLEEQETKIYGRKTSGINPTYQRLKEELLRSEAEVEALKAKKITHKVHLDELKAKLENLNQVELELKQLEQEIEVDRENYRLYLSKLEESRISDAMDSEKIANVSLIQPARAPRNPVKPKKMLNLFIAVFLGICGGLGLAFFREYLDDRIEKVEDVEKELQLPVLASIPVFDKKAASAESF